MDFLSNSTYHDNWFKATVSVETKLRKVGAITVIPFNSKGREIKIYLPQGDNVVNAFSHF